MKVFVLGSASTADPVAQAEVNATTATINMTSIGAGVYRATVEAFNGAIWGRASDSVEPLVVGVPGQVGKPTVVGSNGELAVTWQAPSSDPYPPSTQYFANVRQAATACPCPAHHAPCTKQRA